MPPVIVPIVAIAIFLQIFGLQNLHPAFMPVIAIGLFVLVILSIWIAAKLFQREVILTRWK